MTQCRFFNFKPDGNLHKAQVQSLGSVPKNWRKKKSSSRLISHTDPIYLVPQSKYYEKEYFYCGYRYMGQKNSICNHSVFQ